MNFSNKSQQICSRYASNSINLNRLCALQSLCHFTSAMLFQLAGFVRILMIKNFFSENCRQQNRYQIPQTVFKQLCRIIYVLDKWLPTCPTTHEKSVELINCTKNLGKNSPKLGLSLIDFRQQKQHKTDYHSERKSFHVSERLNDTTKLSRDCSKIKNDTKIAKKRPKLQNESTWIKFQLQVET